MKIIALLATRNNNNISVSLLFCAILELIISCFFLKSYSSFIIYCIYIWLILVYIKLSQIMLMMNLLIIIFCQNNQSCECSFVLHQYQSYKLPFVQ